jgi:hypothetical protein
MPRSLAGHRREYLFLILLFVVEAIVFYTQLWTQITPFYPANFDQTAYFNEVYSSYADFTKFGWLPLFKLPFTSRSGTGVGLIIQGTLAGILGGPNRTAFLSLNLLYFFGLQLALFFAVRVRTETTTFSWIAVALLISCASIFEVTGGIFDFRFDFCSLCLFAIWSCFIVWSRTFLDLRPSITASLVAALLISIRFIAAIYVVAIEVALIVIVFGTSRWVRNPARRLLAKQRLRNCTISLLATLVLASPFLGPAAIPFATKYVNGHALGTEKYMRMAEVGIHNNLQFFLFYPRSILSEHLGNPTLWAVSGLVVFSAAALMLIGTSLSSLKRSLEHYLFDFVFLGLAVCLPVIILTADIAKSAVVGGIVVGPIVLGLTLFAAAAWQASSPGGLSNRFQFGPLLALQVALIAMGSMTFLAHSSARQHQMSRLDLDRINDLNGAMARYAVENGILKPQFSIDRIVDYVNHVTLILTGFERFNTQLSVREGLAYDKTVGFNPTPRNVAMRLADESDILVLSDPSLDRAAPYPLNTSIQVYWRDLMTWATENRHLLYATSITGIPYRVFVRPTLRVGGVSADGWITDLGITIEADAKQLHRWPLIVLHGQSDFTLLSGAPRLRARLENSGYPDQELPVSMSVSGIEYEIDIDTRELPASIPGSVSIALTFDRSFVPREVNNSADTRHLVVLAPTSKAMRAAN